MDITVLVVLVAAVNIAALATGAAVAVYRTSRRPRRTSYPMRRPRVERRTP
jgi:hypothetical protein